MLKSDTREMCSVTVNEIADFEQVEYPMSFVALNKVQDIANDFRENRFNCSYCPPNAYFMSKVLLKEVQDSNHDFDSSKEKANLVDHEAKTTTKNESFRTTYSDVNIKENIETDKIDVSNPEFQAAVKQLNDCLKEENLNGIKKIAHNENLTKDEISVAISTHLVQKLSGNVYCSQTKQQSKCPCGCGGNQLKQGHMFVGAENTWHGKLDLLSGNQKSCVAMSITTDITVADNNDEKDITEIGQTLSEKESELCFPSVRKESITQILSQAIVFGWTEYNRHRNYSPYIPSVLIDRHKFLVVIYNPSKDSLMISTNYIPIVTSTGAIEKAGIFILWQILNHRLFFRKRISICEVPCGFQEQVYSVDPYKNLGAYHENIRTVWDGITFPKKSNLIRLDKNKRKRPFIE